MAAALPAPAPAPAPPPRWEVLTSDLTLHRTLERWARTAGMRLRWDAERNFAIAAPTFLAGDFETALAAVLSTPGVRGSDYPLEACIYANSPPLVRVTRLGEQPHCAPATPSAAAAAN